MDRSMVIIMESEIAKLSSNFSVFCFDHFALMALEKAKIYLLIICSIAGKPFYNKENSEFKPGDGGLFGNFIPLSAPFLGY